MCVTASMHAEESKHRGQLAEPVDADLRRTERHADAIAFVEHPVRQLAAQIRPLERVDARQRLAAPERRDLQCSSEQRMPAVGNGRESKTVCGMSVAGGACARRHADRKAGEAHIKCSGGPHPRRSGAAFFVLDLVASTERESTRTPTRRGGGNTRTSLVGAREVRFSTVTTRHSGYTVSVDTELDASNAFLPSIRAGPGLIRILCGDCFQLFTD